VIWGRSCAIAAQCGTRLIEIGRASRGVDRKFRKTGAGYRNCWVDRTSDAQAKLFSQEIVKGVKRSADVLQQAAHGGHEKEIDTMLPRVQQW